MRKRRELWLLSLLLVVIAVPVAIVAGCVLVVRDEMRGDPPDPGAVARSAEAKAARAREAAWTEAKFRQIQRDRLWLRDQGHSIVDRCDTSQTLLTFSWDPVSCRRIVKRYYAVDRKLCPAVPDLGRAITERGWHTSLPKDCAPLGCPYNLGGRWTASPPGGPFKEIVTTWSGRDCPPVAADALESGGRPEPRGETAYVEVRPVDLRGLATRALTSPARHLVTVEIGVSYFRAPTS